MQSFHQSRARILFEVLCALGMSASLVGAWQQTYAPALLAAAGIAALYGVVRAFDMIGRKPASAAAVPSKAAPEPVAAVPSKALPDPVEAEDAVIRSWPLPASSLDESKPAERAPAKAPAKKRRAPKAAKPVQEPEVARIAPEPQPVDIAPEPEAEIDHAPIAPLFEPEPFVRQQQRAAFGRKAG